MKPRIRLHLVESQERPLAPLTRAEKLAKAIAWLRSRNRYVLDRGSERPKWGVPGEMEKRRIEGSYHGMPTLLERIADRFRIAWKGK